MTKPFVLRTAAYAATVLCAALGSDAANAAPVNAQRTCLLNRMWQESKQRLIRP